MTVAAPLCQLFKIQAEKNAIALREMINANRLDANSKKLTKMQKYQETYEKAYNDVMCPENEKDIKLGGQNYVVLEKNKKGNVVATHYYDANGVECNAEKAALAYAKAKAPNYDEDVLNELSDLDLEYETIKEMCETLLESLNAQRQNQQALVSERAKDTHLIQS